MIPTNTLDRFIRSKGAEFPQRTGELTNLLLSIGLGVKVISRIVTTAGFKGLHGYTKNTNIQGETVHKLDEEADEVLVEILSSSGHFGLIVSEERDEPVMTKQGFKDAKYIVAFDPLDGSSNLGTNIPVGTIFTIFRKKNLEALPSVDDFLQTGEAIVAAGYAVYGAMTTLVYSTGQGVHGFTLDPEIGEFILTEEDIEIPESGSIYSVNEGNESLWDESVVNYIHDLKYSKLGNDKKYSARYVGSLVADFDRTIRKGGVFLYPSHRGYPNGKLRLLYECMPMAYIAEQAGGLAYGQNGRILEIMPKSIHDRSPLIFGSQLEVGHYLTKVSQVK